MIRHIGNIVWRFGIIAILFVLLNIGCKNVKQPTQISEAENQHLEYERMVDSLGIRKAHENTKWMFYCIYCDDTARVILRDTTINYGVTFGTLPLRLDYLGYDDGDTVTALYSFYFDDTVRLDLYGIRPGGVSGVTYKKNTDTLLYLMNSSNGILIVSCEDTIPENKCPIREVNPLQPEVIKYIKENRSTLDPWFREEAIRRGVIKA